jgi:hypothetical protein
MDNKQAVKKRSPAATRRRTPNRTHAKNATTFSKAFQPKNRGGRKPGVPNFITREVKEAIIDACNRHGVDGQGTGGLQGYMFKLCAEQPGAMAGLLGRIMPTQVTVERKERPEPYQTYEQMCVQLERQYGIKLNQPVFQLEFYKGPVVEVAEEDGSVDADASPEGKGE